MSMLGLFIKAVGSKYFLRTILLCANDSVPFSWMYRFPWIIHLFDRPLPRDVGEVSPAAGGLTCTVDFASLPFWEETQNRATMFN